MRADWEFEVGSDAPVIDALWPGFVDLRTEPVRAYELTESSQSDALARMLEKLNGQDSRVWTSKSDFWPALEPGEFDGDELDAPSGQCSHGAAAYIDLLPRKDDAWSTPELIEAAARRLCAQLAAVPLLRCRADLVLRRAVVALDRTDFGITAYLTACGANPVDALHALESATVAFGNALCPDRTLQ